MIDFAPMGFIGIPTEFAARSVYIKNYQIQEGTVMIFSLRETNSGYNCSTVI